MVTIHVFYTLMNFCSKPLLVSIDAIHLNPPKPLIGGLSFPNGLLRKQAEMGRKKVELGIKKSGRQDLNLRPRRPERRAPPS